MDEDAFAVEREQLLSANLSLVSIRPDEISLQAISEWADDHDKLVRTLDNKISRIPTIHHRRLFRDRMIKHFLEGQNTLEELRKYPTVYENIRMAKSDRERYLATECILATGSPVDILNDALYKIQQIVKAEVPGVSNHTIEAVAWEAVSDWLIRCPLDFPNEASEALNA
jgi:metal-dependent hydrolase (beta-lactamase superfamily II)